MTIWEKNLELYDALVDKNKNFNRKGKTMPYTSANGYMFSFINKAGEFGIRLPKDKAKAFREKYNTGEFKSNGAVMKDYVHIPNDTLQNDGETVSGYLQDSFRYVMSLPKK